MKISCAVSAREAAVTITARDRSIATSLQATCLQYATARTTTTTQGGRERDDGESGSEGCRVVGCWKNAVADTTPRARRRHCCRRSHHPGPKLGKQTPSSQQPAASSPGQAASLAAVFRASKSTSGGDDSPRRASSSSLAWLAHRCGMAGGPLPSPTPSPSELSNSHTLLWAAPPAPSPAC